MFKTSATKVLGLNFLDAEATFWAYLSWPEKWFALIHCAEFFHVAQIAVAEDSGLNVEMLKWIFQVFNNFSMFHDVVMNETGIKQSDFVLEREAEMDAQSNGWVHIPAGER